MIIIENKKTEENIILPTPTDEPIDIKKYPWIKGDPLTNEEIKKWFLFHMKKKSKIPKMNEIEKLKEENEDLKSKLIDITFEMNYNKQTELIEFLREIYDSIIEEMAIGRYNKLTRKEILFSLKKNIEEFARNNNLNLK